MEVVQINMRCQSTYILMEDQEENDQINMNYETVVQNNENQGENAINKNDVCNNNNAENQHLDGAIEQTCDLSEGEKFCNNNNNSNGNNKWKKKNFSDNNINNGDVLNFPDSYNDGDYGNFEKYADIRNKSNSIFLYETSENGVKNGNNNNGGNNNNNNNNKKNKNNDDNQTNFITVGGNFQKADSQKTIFTFFIKFLGLKRNKYDVLDSFVLPFHYRFGAAYFFTCFILVWLNFYNKEQLACIGSVIDTKMYIKNICLSYSFYKMPDGTKKTIFFYRWAHFSCLVVAAVYLLLKLLIKKLGNSRLQNMFSNIIKNSSRLDENKGEDQVSTFMKYFKESIGTHGDFYKKYLFNHVCCFSVTLLNFWFLNFVLQGEFIRLGSNVFPFHRDPDHFRDPLSMIFPPFVTCFIGHGSKMLNQREEEYNCYFYLMEMMEKVFVFAWLYMVVALVIGGISIIFLLCLPFHKKFLLSTKESSWPYKKLRKVLANHLCFGDVFLLFRIKNHLTANEFCKVLIEILKYLNEDPNYKED